MVLCCLQLAQNLSVFRKAIGFVFAVDESSVHFDVEHTARSFDQFGLHSHGLLNGCCQTGSLRGVVSHDTVGDPDVHRVLHR